MDARQIQDVLIVGDSLQGFAPLAGELMANRSVRVRYSPTSALPGAATDTLPDLILLDDEGQGHSLCRLLKQDSRTEGIPIILVCGKEATDQHPAGLVLGTADRVSKPIDLPVALARIRNLLLLKKRGDMLEKLAFVDSVTEIANRRKFEQALVDEWRRCQRNSIPLGLCIMDVDFFKALNDSYGHVSGDDCLKKIAQAMADVVRRPGDLVARFGGDEFAAILPGTHFEGTRFVCERFRQAVNQLCLRHPASPSSPFVTISAGASCVIPAQGQNGRSLVEDADRMLYQAKNLGRNRCFVGRLEQP